MRPLHSPRHRTAAAAALAVTAAGLGALATNAAAVSRATCHGRPVTITASKGTVNGTARADVIALTGRASVTARAGDDIICGSNAGDTIDAGPGNDIVLGRRGADTIDGGTGRDQLYGEAGNDRLSGGLGGDVLMGGSGKDTVVVNSRSRESQIGDTVMPGTKAVSLVVQQGSVEALLANGQQVAMTWAAIPGSFPVAWDTFSPMINNSVWLSGGLAAYVSSNSDQPMPGLGIVPTAQVAISMSNGAASLSPTWNLAVGPTMGTTPSLLNNGLNMAQGGLAKQVAINGMSGGWPPINGSVLYAESVLPLPMPTSLTLFMPMGPPPQPGTVLYPGATSDVPHITLNTATRTEVQAVSYDINNGFRTDS